MEKSKFIAAKKHKSEKKIEISTLVELNRVFKMKSWEISNDSEDKSSLFNRFIATLEDLSYEQQQLILELTARFEWIQNRDYEEHLKKALDSMLNDRSLDFTKVKTIYVAPLIAPKDFGKNKSSKYVLYMFPNILHYNSQLKNISIQTINELEVDKDINWEISVLILLDDFIGTGNTAKEAIDYLMTDKGVNPQKIIVLSIASMETGIKLISNLGVSNYTSMELKKGITDYYTSEEAQSKLQVMNEIEEKIKIHRNEKFGYGKSEGLVKLIKTPNNTFPVYWKEKGRRIAPFPRF